MKRSYLAGALFAAVVSAGPAIPAVVAQTAPFVPVTQAMQANPDPADWLHISRTYDERRFSPLKQINKANVAQLDRKSTRLNSSHIQKSRMPSSA